jgi:dTDP-4-dehydrorhamnose reductase
MKNKIAILGDGYLGSSFREEASINDMFREITVFGKGGMLFNGNPIHDLEGFITLDNYDVIVNCIAKSNTRFCENNYKEAYFSNVIVPRRLSEFCKDKGKKYVHISTGCLYDINSQPQKETDYLAAHCNYTLTKWLAEKEIEDNDNCLIVRPRLLFDDTNKPVNLLSKIDKFNKLCNELDSVTSIHVLKTAILKLIEADCTGVFNVACDGYTSMYELGGALGLEKEKTSIQEIRLQQGLHLVNNIMDISKLKEYYNPPNIIDEVKRCWFGRG